MRFRIVLAAMAIATPALAQEASLSGAQIKAAFAGRTVSGTEDGAAYQEKLLANGSIQGRSSLDGSYTGEWEVDGNEICFYYDDDDEDDDEDCSRVILKGASVTFINEDGSRSRATLR
ncbi:hypothetical protein [Rhizobium sp. BE258]|uniref:hypothetical protein n=1 Tax=Rhizobium sp. BE258 TaxID=2817722 RepID=UPI00285A94E5|nr:hypothetical protein [Rhizobium sp. BE258]MDR7141827.1 hypothetical protein [Rhizobium sp. BE258]